MQPCAAQILERQVDAAALEVVLDVAEDVGQLQRDAEVQRVLAAPALRQPKIRMQIMPTAEATRRQYSNRSSKVS